MAGKKFAAPGVVPDLLAAAFAVVFSGAEGFLAAEPRPAAPDKPAPAPAVVRLDRFGDPLPAGVIARLGTVRLQHPCGVSSAGFSPDGKLLASSGNDGTTRLSDVSTGKEVRRFAETYNSAIFTRDGKSLITGGEKVRVWDVASGRLLSTLPTADCNSVTCPRGAHACRSNNRGTSATGSSFAATASPC